MVAKSKNPLEPEPRHEQREDPDEQVEDKPNVPVDDEPPFVRGTIEPDLRT
jgi:hypothetical protein